MTTSNASFSYRRNYRGPIQAVILDWAGTTLDFGSCSPVIAICKAFSLLEVPISNDIARGPMGKSKREHIQSLLENPEVKQRWETLHGPVTADAVEKVYAQFLGIQSAVLAEHATLIPGCLEAIDYCRGKGMKIGSTTGYTRELMDILLPLAARQGYQPDAMVCASDVKMGRPAPWLCFQAAYLLEVYPSEAVVKVDDTLVGIEAGLNAGMWTVGVAISGNLVGLSKEELDSLPASERNKLRSHAHGEMRRVGTHFVIDTIADLPVAMREIRSLLDQGLKP